MPGPPEPDGRVSDHPGPTAVRSNCVAQSNRADCIVSAHLRHDRTDHPQLCGLAPEPTDRATTFVGSGRHAAIVSRAERTARKFGTTQRRAPRFGMRWQEKPRFSRCVQAPVFTNWAL